MSNTDNGCISTLRANLLLASERREQTATLLGSYLLAAGHVALYSSQLFIHKYAFAKLTAPISKHPGPTVAALDTKYREKTAPNQYTPISRLVVLCEWAEQYASWERDVTAPTQLATRYIIRPVLFNACRVRDSLGVFDPVEFSCQSLLGCSCHGQRVRCRIQGRRPWSLWERGAPTKRDDHRIHRPLGSRLGMRRVHRRVQ